MDTERGKITYSDEQWAEWMDQLAFRDYVVVDDFISDELLRKIKDFFSSAEKDEKLKKAGIGSSGEFQIDSAVRGDFIYWLDKERDTEMVPFFELMDDIIEKLKQFCFLSLSGSEFHIAKYPPGSHYQKHLDQFNERSNRQITVLIYLNENWKKEDGGELKIYQKDTETIIEPIAKRLILFKSDKVEHEVLTTNIYRYSLTGWLLKQPTSVGYLF